MNDENQTHKEESSQEESQEEQHIEEKKTEETKEIKGTEEGEDTEEGENTGEGENTEVVSKGVIEEEAPIESSFLRPEEPSGAHLFFQTLVLLVLSGVVCWVLMLSFSHSSVKNIIPLYFTENKKLRHKALYKLYQKGGTETHPILVLACEDTSSEIRLMAQMATHGLDYDLDSVLDSLFKIVEEKEEIWIRLNALRALGSVGFKEKKVLLRLKKYLQDPNPRIRKEVIKTIQKFGKRGNLIVLDILKGLQDPELDIRENIAFLLLEIAPKNSDPTIVPSLLLALKNKTGKTQIYLVEVLKEMAVDEKGLLLAFEKALLEEPERQDSPWIPSLLEEISLTKKTLIPILLENIEHPNPNIQYNVIENIGSFSPLERSFNHKEIVSVLRKVVKEGELDLRLVAIQTLGKLDHKATRVVIPDLVELQASKIKRIRVACKVALNSIGPGTEAEMPFLLPGLLSQDERVRKQTIASLGSIKSAKAIPEMIAAMKKEKQEYLYREFLYSFQKINSLDCLPALALAQKHKSWSVRNEVIHILSKFTSEKEDVITLLIEGTKDSSPEVRKKACWALGKLKNPKGIVAVMRLLLDRNEKVCLQALFALREMNAKQAVAMIRINTRFRSKRVRNVAAKVALELEKK